MSAQLKCIRSWTDHNIKPEWCHKIQCANTSILFMFSWFIANRGSWFVCMFLLNFTGRMTTTTTTAVAMCSSLGSDDCVVSLNFGSHSNFLHFFFICLFCGLRFKWQCFSCRFSIISEVDRCMYQVQALIALMIKLDVDDDEKRKKHIINNECSEFKPVQQFARSHSHSHGPRKHW